MEDLFTEAAIARVARIQTTAEESEQEPEKAATRDKNGQETVGDDHSGEKDKEQQTAEKNKLEKSSSTPKAAPKAHKFKRKHQDDDTNHTIFVGNVPANIKKKKLKQFFKYDPCKPFNFNVYIRCTLLHARPGSLGKSGPFAFALCRSQEQK